MRKVLLTRGIPASGKTTWAKQYVAASNGQCKRICKDELRLMFDNNHDFGIMHEKFLNNVRDEIIKTTLCAGFDIVVDETFIRQEDIDRVSNLCKRVAIGQGFLMEFEVVPFDTLLDSCILADAARYPSLGEDVIREYASEYAKALEVE